MKQDENYIYAITIDDISDKYPVLYYSPLTRQVSFEPIASPDVGHMPVSLRSVDDLRKMSVLPNHRCNFKCDYCYAANSRNAEELELNIADKALAYFINRKRTCRPLSVAILGGGEPMLSWPVTRHCIEEARRLASGQDIHLEITVVTNGSIVDDEIIDTFVANDVIVNASFDLISESNLRGGFENVKDNIKLMCRRGVYVTINSTVTPANVGDMKRMVKNAKEWFPAVEFMIFEPVIARHLFADAKSLRNFYGGYVGNFFDARDYAAGMGIDLTCRILKSLDGVHDRGCDGRFNLCPNGDVTICYCTASGNDPNFENRLFGKVDASGVHFFEDRFQNICNENVFSMPKCEHCFAKYNCAGGCMLPNDRYDECFLDEICRFNKEFIRRELLRRAVR